MKFLVNCRFTNSELDATQKRFLKAVESRVDGLSISQLVPQMCCNLRYIIDCHTSLCKHKKKMFSVIPNTSYYCHSKLS